MEAADFVPAQSGSNINNLPIEILLIVFSFFTPEQLCSLIAQVCPKWHQLSRNPLLWKRLRLNYGSVCSVLALFRTAPLKQLTVLEVMVWRGAGDALVTLVAEHCPSLVTFVNASSGLSVHSDSLAALAQNCPQIEELSFSLDTLADRKYSVFSRFPKLRMLGFGFELGADQTNSGFELKPSDSEHSISLIDCKQLKELNAHIVRSQSRVRFGDDQFNARFNGQLCKFVRHHRPVLTSLDNLSCGVAMVDSFCEISKCIHLQDLRICPTDFLTDDLLLAITANLKQLRYLMLGSPFSPSDQITNAGLMAAFSSADSLTKLSQLRFSGLSAVDDAVVTVIADRFAQQLTSLSLRSCDAVTDAGFARVLAKCSALVSLELEGVTQLSEASFRSIPTALPMLKSLTMTGGTVDRAVIEELKNARPDLRIY